MTPRPPQDPAERPEPLVTRFTDGIGSPVSIVLHTLAFAACFLLVLLGVARLETMLLALTTAVSLEAIYLALFIQMTVNRTTDSLESVEEDIAEIVEDVAEIEKDVDEIEKDVDEIQRDEAAQEARDKEDAASLKVIEERLASILADLERLRR